MATQHHIQRDMISSAQSLLNISKKTMSRWSGKRSEDGGAREM